MSSFAIHHLNCGTMCPFGRRLVTGQGSLREPARLVCHCLVVETDDGLVLVDSGVGLEAVARPRERLGPFMHVARFQLDPAETAVRQVERLGFGRDDVRHIVLTHLDIDHAGGIADFPSAKVHVMRAEHEAATRPSLRERVRYRSMQWDHGPDWALYEPSRGERWHGFECVRDLEGLPPEILLVPLAGHSRGHAAVAVRHEGGWLLHCGDAYFFGGEADPDRPRCPAGLRVFQRIAAHDDGERRHNQQRLRSLVRQHGDSVRVFSAHDPGELEALV